MHTTLAKLSAFLQTYGPWGVFCLALLDSMGVPLPTATDFVLLTIGMTSLDTPSVAYFAAFMALAGSLIGNVILFQAVRQGRRLVTKEEAAPGKFQQWFRQYGLLTVFVPAVVPIVPLPLKVFVISAGAFRTPFARFVTVITAARVIRYFGLAYLAMQLGADAEGFLRRNAWTMVGVAIVVALLLYFAMRRRQPELLYQSGAGAIWVVSHKPVAVEAGLGHMGIHRNLIHPKFGNFILLGTVLMDLEASNYDHPIEYNPCLECKLCVAACPVGAIGPEGSFNFSSCFTHNYREFLGGFSDWVDQVADARDAIDYRRGVSATLKRPRCGKVSATARTTSRPIAWPFVPRAKT